MGGVQVRLDELLVVERALAAEEPAARAEEADAAEQAVTSRGDGTRTA